MPVPPSLASARVATPIIPTQSGMTLAPGPTQSTQTSANPNPQMQVVGVDAQPFSAIANPSATVKTTVTFPNLPKRATLNSPLSQLQATKNQLNIGPNDYLLLTCYVQSKGTGAQISVLPQAVTATGAVTTGPFLGSENFVTFQAVVEIVAQQVKQLVKGTVVAHLTLARG